MTETKHLNKFNFHIGVSIANTVVSKWYWLLISFADTEEQRVCVRDLNQSKWSKDVEGEIEEPEAFIKRNEEQLAMEGMDQSKWSSNVEENPEASKGNGHVPSGLVRVSGKSKKSVCWGDRVITVFILDTCHYYIFTSLMEQVYFSFALVNQTRFFLLFRLTWLVFSLVQLLASLLIYL